MRIRPHQLSSSEGCLSYYMQSANSSAQGRSPTRVALIFASAWHQPVANKWQQQYWQRCEL